MARARPAAQPPENEEAAAEQPARSKATDHLVREVRYLLRARNHLLWITSLEERRAERIIGVAAALEKYQVRYWDCAEGARDLEGARVEIGSTGKPETHPAAVFDKIRAGDERAVWVLRDLHDWCNDRAVVRNLKSIARNLQDVTDKSRLVTIIILSAAEEVPLNLRNSAVKWDWPLPAREEVEEILDDVIMAARKRSALETWEAMPEEQQGRFLRAPDGTFLETEDTTRRRLLCTPGDEDLTVRTDAVVSAALGLTADDMSAAFARSIVRLKRVDSAMVAAEKKRMVSQVPGITWYEPDPRGLDALGGLSLLKEELLDLRTALAPDAQEFGLAAPRGILLVGPPGTGKSATAKATATAFEIPLIKLDLAALKGGTVGTSEANIRRALKVVQAVKRCVLWVDEIDQALAGATSEHTGDSGVSKDQLGTLLTFLQEHAGFIFLIATTNNPHRLPPELTRAGRFNATFFCDLPSTREREEILAVSLRALPVPRDPARFDLGALAAVTDGFSGAELAELPAMGLRKAYRARRELALGDMMQAREETVPVSRSAAEAIARLREWAKSRARPASEPEEEHRAIGGFGRRLEIDPTETDEEDIQ
jgi:ATP-dependent 26S proteasome regulatory subunit